MGKINWARVLLGGLLAGVIVNIFEYVMNVVVFGREWEAAMKAVGQQTPPNAALYVVWGFLMGIGAIALYAAARPRFGPGPKTAAWTGFGYWVFAYALPNFGYSITGLFPQRLMIITTLVGLVELILASVVGAWLYKE